MVAVARMAVCLSLFLLICQVRGIYVSQRVNETIQNLLRHYKFSNREIFSGNPIFPRDPPHGKREVKMVFMSGVLETYEKLFGQMLNQLPTSTPPTADSTPPSTGTRTRLQPGQSVRSNLNYVLGMIKEIKKGYFQEEEKLLDELRDLRHIQINSSVVQAKALFELPRMLEQAGTVAHNDSMRRRRRRQAKSRMALRG
ncbi:interferon gamma-like [Acanthochromis polyacanthus]|uniref:interferon gamma-like n=1 Tax=Acanthochromis polyacanthus TaxID=80966 RepID=UPI002234D8A9|nr:interferon gamma-like [Acanthochromis polyacanthus]